MPDLPKRFEDVLRFPRQFERAVRDQHGLRSELRRASAWLRSRMRASVSVSPLVARGPEGWLFLAGGWGTNTGPEGAPSDELVARYVERIVQWSDWLRAREIEYVFVLAPAKASIYPEQQPAWLRARSGDVTARFLAELRARATFEVIDLRPILEARRREGRVFYKYDLHWNALGGLLAASALSEALELPLRSSCARLEAHEITWQEQGDGALARLVGQGQSLQESTPVIRRQRPSRIAKRRRVKQNEEHGRGVRYSTSDKRGPRTVLAGDSFLLDEELGMLRFLRECLSASVGVRFPHTRFSPMPRLVTVQRPELVINMVSEFALGSDITKPAGEIVF